MLNLSPFHVDPPNAALQARLEAEATQERRL